MSIDQLMAEITSGGFAQYEESGLINPTDLRTWIRNELKRFGGNLTDRKELILHIKNSKAKLPFHFWQLYLAVQCEISGYEVQDPSNVLQNSFFYRERVEGVTKWDNGNETYCNQDTNYVREDYSFHDARATFHYGKHQPLRLVKGFDKSLCNSECPNLRQAIVGNNTHEINIKHDYLYANFKEGTIYIQYDGLPEDEEGNLIIPETQHNRLKEYLIYYCRMRILEDIIMGDDDASKVNMLSYYDRKQSEAFMLAMTEVKMEALGKDWKRKVRNKMRRETLKYSVMLPTR